MSTERELRKRIKSIKNIGQVTRALEAVSASKVRKAQAQVLATRPYTRKAWEILGNLAAQVAGMDGLHPLLEVRSPVKNASLVLFTSDRGLCGAFNTNLLRFTWEFMSVNSLDYHIVPVGRKGRDAMYRAGTDITASFSQMPDSPSILDITAVARTVIDDYLENRVDVVYLAYMDFVNTMVQRPVIRRLLPLTMETEELTQEKYVQAGAAVADGLQEYVYEPNPAAIMEQVVPRFTELQIFQALLESQASEHSARMVAMRNASENASALVEELTLARNKARQASITSELLDIAGGAEALAQAMAAEAK